MIGKKPNTIPTQIIVRRFRGVQLFLSKVTRAPKGFAWSSNRKHAQRYDAAEALSLAREASRDYGAECVTVDAHGTLTYPTLAVDMVTYDKRGRETSRKPATLWQSFEQLDNDARAWSIKS